MYAYRMVKIQSCFKVRIILPLKFLHHNFVLHCEIWHFLCALTKTSMTTSLSYIFLSLLELLATILESPQYYPLVYFTAPVLYVKCKINQISCVYIFILFYFHKKKKKNHPIFVLRSTYHEGSQAFPNGDNQRPKFHLQGPHGDPEKMMLSQ